MAHPMSKRRATPPAIVAKPFRGRRLNHRRTPADNVRVSAAWVVERTLSMSAPSSEFLAGARARLDEYDHGLLHELSLGTLRWLRRLDHVIATASNRPLEKIEPALRAPLRVAAYQLLFLDRVPPHAAVSEAVEHARRVTHRGGASFTNAVLRRIARQPKLDDWPVRQRDPGRRLAIEMSHPDFLVERWIQRFGLERTRDLLDANNRPKPMHLLAFRDRGGRELLAENLIDDAIAVEPSKISPLGLVVREGNPLRSQSFACGDLYVQDEASQAAALIPPLRPGERVLDAAAAPGGKSFTLLAAEPDVRVVLADASVDRLGVLEQNLGRLGRRLPVVAADAGRPAFAAGGFDRVILDLPCTGTGTFRKCPELKWRISEAEIGRLASQSLRMLAGAAPLVAEGGYLIAITCSLEAEENEEVVARFLERHPQFSLLALEDRLEFPLDRWIIGRGVWRLSTADEHDGFTVHALVRERE
jgi:16S rRNA (cytosine967-C5)-methyltransferase